VFVQAVPPRAHAQGGSVGAADNINGLLYVLLTTPNGLRGMPRDAGASATKQRLTMKRCFVSLHAHTVLPVGGWWRAISVCKFYVYQTAIHTVNATGINAVKYSLIRFVSTTCHDSSTTPRHLSVPYVGFLLPHPHPPCCFGGESDALRPCPRVVSEVCSGVGVLFVYTSCHAIESSGVPAL